ncbi:MAG: leucine-rich repeat protein [Clostridia bacterium]|nr:leucine-rich repeat protein [Clostridia bacterium]
MKKKILLMLALITLLTCVFAVAVSAADPTSKYAIELKVKMDGEASYITVFAPNSDNDNPRLYMADGFYKTATYDGEAAKYTFTDAVDIASIAAIDFSEAVCHKSRATVVKSMVSSSSVSFAKCKELKWFKAGSGALAEIPDRLCLNWTALDTIDFGCATVTGDNTFENTGFTTLTIPSTIDKLKSSSFRGCTKLETLKIEGNIPTINASVFYGCTALKNVDLGSITTIGKCMFQGCTALESITIPSTVTTIVQEAFLGCSSLVSVDLGSCVETIEYATFSGTALTSITIPASVKTLGNSVFNNAKSLTSITFEEGSQLKAVGNKAFDGVKASFTLTNSLDSVGAEAFRNTGISGTVTISRNCTSIGSQAFYGCTGITAVVFEEGCQITTIESDAFNGCTGLTSIVIPDSVTTIGGSAFYNVPATNINIPTSLTSLGARAYRNTGISKVKIPAAVENILYDTFWDCKNLETLEFAEGSQLKSIGSNSFSGCVKLTSITFPEGLLQIDGGAFTNSGLSGTLVIPNSVTTLGSAFGSTAIERLIIGAGVTSVTGSLVDRAYGVAEKIQEIYLPAGLVFANTESNMFGNSNSNLHTFYIIGTDYDALVAQIKALRDVDVYKDYEVVAYTEGTDYSSYDGCIVVGINTCDFYYEGNHIESDEVVEAWLNADGTEGEAFLSYFKASCSCQRNCGKESIVDYFAPLFVDRGFAYGPSSMLQGVAVDRELLDEYAKYFNEIKFGLVAAAKSAQTSASIIDANGVGANKYVAAVDYTDRPYDLFEMNLYGITEDYETAEFYFGAYVIANGTVYYIHNGTTNSEAQSITYNDVVVIVDALLPTNKDE